MQTLRTQFMEQMHSKQVNKMKRWLNSIALRSVSKPNSITHILLEVLAQTLLDFHQFFLIEDILVIEFYC
jgi:hypothetical protein